MIGHQEKLRRSRSAGILVKKEEEEMEQFKPRKRSSSVGAIPRKWTIPNPLINKLKQIDEKPSIYKTIKDISAIEIAEMTEEKLKHYIPKSWTYSSNNGRVHIKDAKGNYKIRIDQPDKIVKYPHIHIYNSKNESLSITNTPVSQKDIRAHIPYYQTVIKPKP